MLKLCGFHISNYHNKVRIVLLEKGIPFEEDASCNPSQEDEFLARTPIGKVPFLELDGGRRLSESEVIFEYLEDAYPQKPLLPKDPYAAAKVRELVTFVDLHVELVARELYPKAFFGGTISEGNAARVRQLLTRNIAAFQRLARFAPALAAWSPELAELAGIIESPLFDLPEMSLPLPGSAGDWVACY